MIRRTGVPLTRYWTVCPFVVCTDAGRKPQHLLLALSLVILLIAGCKHHENPSVPTQLIGTWGTEEPRYSELFLDITHDSVVFTTAEGGVETYWISKVESAGKGNTVMHVLYGERAGEHLDFKFYYQAKDGGILRFKNQIGIPWHRVKNLSD